VVKGHVTLRHDNITLARARELKAKEILEVKWRAGVDMITLLYTKNLSRHHESERHAREFVGADEYVK
jgi:hypothetical protein